MFGKAGALTLTQRLFVLTAVSLTPAFLILLYNVVALRETRDKEVHATALQTGRIAALEMDRIVYGAEDVLRAIAAAPEIQARREPACSAYLRRVDADIARFWTVRIVGPDGSLQCSSEDPLPEVSFVDRQYLQEALSTHRFVVGTFTEDRADGRRVLPLALALAGDSGVIVGTLDLEWLGHRLREREYGQDNALTIADRDGVILAREPFPERFVGTRIPEAFQDLVRASEPGTMEVTSQDGTRRVIGYVPASAPPEGLYVSAGIARDNAFAPLNDAALLGSAMAVAGLVLAFLATWFTGRALVRRPVDRLLRTVDAWRRGEEAARTGMTDTEGEIGSVGRAVDGFMDEIVADRKLRREAEEHRELLLKELDHRVKNILATVQAIARQTFREDVDTGEAMDVYTARLSAIASAHGLLISNHWRSADLADVVAAAIAPFREQGDGRFTVEGPRLVVNAKPALALSMAIHELCTNSVKYGALSRDGGRVRIRWSVSGGTPAAFCFTWTDENGPPVRTPSRKGFGSRMIERLLAAEIGARVELDYPETGVSCRIEGPVAGLAAKEAGRTASLPGPEATAPSPAAAPVLGSA